MRTVVAVVVLIAALCLFMLTLLTGAIEHPFTRMLDRPSRVAELMANVQGSALRALSLLSAVGQ
jgi:hypothetical protein